MGWDRHEDVQLLRAALRDREAFAFFYRQHVLAVYRWFAYRVARDPAAASELTAETFAEALRSLPRFAGTRPGSGTAWLFGIARNLAREHHRSRRIRDRARRDLRMPRSTFVEGAFQDAEERIDADGLREELDSALAELPPAQREAVLLRVVDDLDYRSIARVAETNEQTVRLRVSRGLRALRAQLASPTNQEDS